MKSIDPFSFVIGFLLCAFEAIVITGISRLFGMQFEIALLVGLVPSAILALIIVQSHE